MWESCAFYSLLSCFVAVPQVKNRLLTTLNKWRRLEWCTSMLQRLGEAKKWCLGTFLARHTLLQDSTPFYAPLQAMFTPCSFTHSSQFLECFRVSTFRCLLVCLSLPLVGMSPRESFHDAASDLMLETMRLQADTFSVSFRSVSVAACVSFQPVTPQNLVVAQHFTA